MIRLSCPRCGGTFSAPEERAGKTGKCPCGERVRVPDITPASMNVTAMAQPKGLVITPKMWVLIIAGGVVLGLFVWTTANGLIAEWVKAREETQNRLKKEEQDRKEAERRRQSEKESEEWLKRQHEEARQKFDQTDWDFIFSSAEHDRKTLYPRERKSLRELIEGDLRYQQILEFRGRTLTLQHEYKALNAWIENIERRLQRIKESPYGDILRQAKVLEGLLTEFEEELQRVQRELSNH